MNKGQEDDEEESILLSLGRSTFDVFQGMLKDVENVSSRVSGVVPNQLSLAQRFFLFPFSFLFFERAFDRLEALHYTIKVLL